MNEPAKPIEADARDIVIRRIARQVRRFPNFAISPLETVGLDERDAGLAHAIHDAVLRRWLTLAHVIGAGGGKPVDTLEPKMQAVLLVGAAQLLLFDRVPDHAVLDESVGWAKRAIRPGAGAMVNAILRKVATLRGGKRHEWTNGLDELPLGDGSAVGLGRAVLPVGEGDRLAAGTGVPKALFARWSGAFGFKRARELALHTLVRAPVALHIAHARAPIVGDAVEGRPGALLEPGDVCAHESGAHRVFTGAHERLRAFLGARDDVWVQDAASSGAVASVAHLSPGLIVDVCAGQGTKTRQLVAQFPGARIIAGEVDKPRLETLRRVFEGVERVEVMHAKRLGDERAALVGRADLVLLDVPCSNTGVLPRRVEAKYRVSDVSQLRMVGVQRQIAADAMRLLGPGGRVLYSTCSVEPEENEGLVEWLGQQHGLRVEAQRRVWPAGLPGDGVAAYHDGAYSAVLAH